MSQKVALHTLGCKLNFSETSTIGHQFIEKGYDVVELKDKADVYVFNTCTVTENAEKECRQLVRRALRQNPNAFVIVTGCYAQLRPVEIAEIDGVDVVLGSKEKFQLFSILNNFEKNDLSCIHVSPTDELNDFGPAHSTDADSRTRAFLKIQDGCDYKCSFCTIPKARGKSRSMQPEEVLKTFRDLIDNGYKEIILTGVNVGDYGKVFGTNLYNLLTKMVNVPGKFRIRISSIEPNLLSDDILELTANNEKMCDHFHIPMQSGSSEILKSMRRRYNASYYEKLIHTVKQRIKDVGIGVDVIVGYPGETEEEFLKTYNFLRDMPISYLHVFTYSERPGTHAISLEGSVDVFERKRRNKMLRILSEKKRHQFYSGLIGKDLEVLFESQNQDGTIKGFTSNYVRVNTTYSDELVNEFVTVKLSGISNGICEGNLKETKKAIDLKAS